MYTIYHIPGRKIGCTNNLERRMKQYPSDYEFEIIETHTDIEIASDREIELQNEYGYPQDPMRYAETIRRLANSEAQRAKSLKRTEYAYEPHYFTKEERAKAHEHPNSFKNKRIVCEYCGNPQTTGNYARWHGLKCKHRTQE